MTEEPTQYTLNLNGPKGRITLRILAFTAPLYLIAAPLWIFAGGTIGLEKLSIFAQILLFVPSLIAAWGLFHLLNKVITISLYSKNSKLSTHQTYLANIDKVSLLPEKNSITITRGRKVVTAPLKNLDQTNTDRLLEILKKLPKLQNGQGLTTELVKLKRQGQLDDSVKLKYSSHMMMRRTIEAIKEGERTFWSMWTFGWSTLALFLLSNLLFKESPLFLPFQIMSDVLLGVVGLLVYAAVLPSTLFVTYLTKDIYGQLFIVFGAVTTLCWLWSMLLRPNRILLDKEGIAKIFDCGLKEFVIEKIRWSEVADVSLLTKTDELCFKLNTPGKAPLLLMLGGLRSAQSRADLFKAIQKNIPDVARDPSIETSLSDNQASTFTQLWLSSLAIPPKREMLAPLEHGHTLEEGRYVIESTLAAGGQGVAYIAKSAELSFKTQGEISDTDDSQKTKHVILKESVLPLFVDEQSRKKAIDKFEQEALLLKKLDSPHIVKLLDYFIEDHRTYFVLEHIDGMDLRKIVETDGAMSADKVLNIARQMSDILDYLHNLSPPVVHRDFTADNLVLNNQNKLKLIDFEVAHEGIQKSTATVVGKHCYIPPEQLRGKPEPASDLYAMGCTLYYLKTGKEPEPLSRQSILTQEQIATAAEDDITLHNIVNQLTGLEPNKRLTNKGLRSLLNIEPSQTNQCQTIELKAEKELAP